MSASTSYNEWYIRADEAWTAYHDCLDQHEDLCEGCLAEAEEMAVLQMDMKQWKEAAEYAEKQMAEIEKCWGTCQPSAFLCLPDTPEAIVRNEVFA